MAGFEWWLGRYMLVQDAGSAWKVYLIAVVATSLFGALIVRVTTSIARQYTEVYMASAMCKSNSGHHRTRPHESIHTLVPRKVGLDKIYARSKL
jgi:hypothetical protein